MSLNNLGENLLRYKIKDKIICTSDTETEGLNLHFNRPWGIAWIVSRGDEIIEKHDRFLWWPDLKVSAGAAMITKFNYSEYKSKAEDPKKVFEELEPMLYGQNTINVMHNGISLDAYMIDSWRRRIGLKSDYSWMKRFLDTNCLAKAVKLNLTPQYPIIPWQYKLDSFIRKGLKTNLTLLSKEYGLQVDENSFHGALFDSEVTRQIFMKILWQLELEDKF